MNKEELRGRYIKEIPKQIIKGEQLSYADWLEQLIGSNYVVNENDLLQRVMPRSFKERRQTLNMSMQDVTDKTNISKATISRIERGNDAFYNTVITLDKFYSENGA